MPNIKSAVKRVGLTKVYAARNKISKSELKNTVKKFTAVTEKSTDAEALYRDAVSRIDKSVRKGVIHKNTAARKKSRLAAMYNALGK